MVNKRLIVNVVSSLLLDIALISASLRAAEEVMVSIFKVDDMPWFNHIGEGVVEADKAFGVSVSQVGPSSADAPQQVKTIEDLIARRVNAIIIVPGGVNVLGPVFKKTRDAEVVVLTNESPSQPSASWDIEIIDNERFIAGYAEHTAKRMDGKSDYVVYMGSLTVPQHNLWTDLLVKYQKEHYPDIHEVTCHMLVIGSVDDPRRTMLDLMKAYPDLKAVVSFGPSDPIDTGRVVKEKQAKGKVAVYDMIIPPQATLLVKSSNITGGIIYNSASAGYTLMAVASTLLKGEEVKPGLEIQDLDKADVDMGKRIIRFHKVLLVNKGNIDSLY